MDSATLSGDTIVISTRKNRIQRAIQRFIRNYYIYKQFRKLRRLNTYEIMEDDTIKRLFKKFINENEERKGVWKNIECYELCDIVLTDILLVNNLLVRESLLKNSPSELWRETLNRAFRYNHRDMGFLVKRLKRDTLVEIECSRGYIDFQCSIRRKTPEMRKLMKEGYGII